MQGSDSERIRQCAAANGWQEGPDYKVGHRSIWLSYFAWKMVEDGLRAVEKGRRQGEDDDESVAPDGHKWHTVPRCQRSICRRRSSYTQRRRCSEIWRG